MLNVPRGYDLQVWTWVSPGNCSTFPENLMSGHVDSSSCENGSFPKYGDANIDPKIR